jgi:hypothetical protein
MKTTHNGKEHIRKMSTYSKLEWLRFPTVITSNMVKIKPYIFLFATAETSAVCPVHRTWYVQLLDCNPIPKQPKFVREQSP